MKETFNRRSLIVGAGFATAAPALVKAESLLDIPGNSLSKRGLLAAKKWASAEFAPFPGARLLFSDGTFYRWMTYSYMWRPARGNPGVPAYAVAIEVQTTDDEGRGFITSIPINGVRLAARHDRRDPKEELIKRLMKEKGTDYPLPQGIPV